MSDAEGLIPTPRGPGPSGPPAAASTATSRSRHEPGIAAGNRASNRLRGRRLGERVGELRCGAEPVGWCLGERAGDRPLHCFGHGLPDGPDPGHGLDHAPGNDRLGGRPGIRRLPGEHLVEHAAEGVDVGAAVDVRVAGRLLGAHVVRRAEGEPGLGQAVAGRGGEGPRDPEVGDDRLPAGEQDVLGLDVAVHHAVLVGVAQRRGDVAGDAHGVVDRELPLARQAVAQRLALDVGHDVEQQVVGRGS